jgi:hypothetical protein
MAHVPAWCLPCSDYVVVAELETGRESFRLGLKQESDPRFSNRGLSSMTFFQTEFRLSGDGSTLMAVYRFTDFTLVRLWDVHPHRAWFWAVASSSATGVALLLLRRWRSKRKAARLRTATLDSSPPIADN